jgi:hypothetical protein
VSSRKLSVGDLVAAGLPEAESRSLIRLANGGLADGGLADGVLAKRDGGVFYGGVLDSPVDSLEEEQPCG